MDDQQIDQLLTAALRRRGESPSLAAGDSCLDAETLAAWAAGTLSTAEAETVELHLSNCARCQEMAAIFAEVHREARERLAPEPRGWGPAAQEEEDRGRGPSKVLRFPVRWVLPLAAAVAASLVWLVWPGARPPDPALQLAKSQPQEETSAAVPPAAPADAPSAPPPATATPKAGTDPADKDKNVQRQLGQSAPRADAQTGTTGTTGTRGTKLDAVSPVETRTAAAPPPQARTQPPQLAQPPATAGGRPATAPPPGPDPVRPAASPVPVPTPAPPPPPTPAPVAVLPPPPPARAEAFRENVADARAVVVEFSTIVAETGVADMADRSRALGGAGRGGGGAGRGGAATPPAAPKQQAAESNVLPRWRVLASGAVERSTDAGASWIPVPIDPPVHIINGASSSPTTCWLIGRQGVVLLSTDGVRFQRVTSPTSSELSTIRAPSARQATVTTADGRTFVTNDGGVTWREAKAP